MNGEPATSSLYTDWSGIAILDHDNSQYIGEIFSPKESSTTKGSEQCSIGNMQETAIPTTAC